jgi:hypothetical protein
MPGFFSPNKKDKKVPPPPDLPPSPELPPGPSPRTVLEKQVNELQHKLHSSDNALLKANKELADETSDVRNRLIASQVRLSDRTSELEALRAELMEAVRDKALREAQVAELLKVKKEFDEKRGQYEQGCMLAEHAKAEEERCLKEMEALSRHLGEREREIEKLKGALELLEGQVREDAEVEENEVLGVARRGKFQARVPPPLAPPAISPLETAQSLNLQLMYESQHRSQCLQSAVDEISALQGQVEVLSRKNKELRDELDREEGVKGAVLGAPSQITSALSPIELELRLRKALEGYREERGRRVALQDQIALFEAESREMERLKRRVIELEQLAEQQRGEILKMKGEIEKVPLYHENAETQEKIINRLEQVLQASLEEVTAAQRNETDRVKFQQEALRLREQCSSLQGRCDLLQREADQVELLKAEISGKQQELDRLREMGAEGGENGELKVEILKLRTSEREWRQRNDALRVRVEAMEEQLTENAKKYGREISTLKIALLKKTSV